MVLVFCLLCIMYMNFYVYEFFCSFRQMTCPAFGQEYPRDKISPWFRSWTLLFTLSFDEIIFIFGAILYMKCVILITILLWNRDLKMRFHLYGMGAILNRIFFFKHGILDCRIKHGIVQTLDFFPLCKK